MITREHPIKELALAVLLLVIAGCGSDGGPAGVGGGNEGDPPPPLHSWGAQVTGSLLQAAWTDPSGQAWMVGRGGTVIVHDGSTMEHRPVAGIPDLQAVHGRSATEVYVAGRQGFPPNDRGVVYGYDGQDWTELHSVDGIGFSSLWAGPSILFALTDNGGCYMYDGTTWTLTGSGAQRAITGRSDTEVYAASFAGVVRKWDGSSWASMSTPTSRNLHAIHAAPGGDVFAAGELGTILRLVSGSWTLMASNSNAFLEGIHARANNDVDCVGRGGVALHFDGTSWSSSATPTTEILEAVVPVSGGGTIAVGWRGTVLERPAGNGWGLRQYGPGQGMLGVAATGPGDVWAAGLGSAVMRRDAGGWSPVPRPGPYVMFAVAVAAPDAAWIFADNGYAYQWDGSSWSESKPSPYDLRGGLALAPDQVWAVGPTVALLWDGTQWIDHSDDVVGGDTVWAAGPDEVWTTGLAAGTLARWDGTSWTSVDTPATTSLDDVWGSGTGEIWAVGWNQAIVHFDGSSWSQPASPFGPDVQVTAVGGSGPKNVFLGAEDGNMARWDGEGWELLPLATAATIHDFFFLSDDAGYAVDNNGAVLGYGPGS